MYEELYEQNKKEILAIAWRYRGLCEKDRAVSVEDIAHAAFIGLVIAANTFDRQSGKSWALHKRRHITAEIYKTLGIHDGKIKNVDVISLDAPISDDSGDLTLSDTLQDDSLPDIDENVCRDEIRVDVRRAIDALVDPRQRQALLLHGIDGHDMTDVALALHVSTAHAMLIYSRGMANLAKDNRLMALTDIDDITLYYRHKCVASVLRDRTSVTEGTALWRIEMQERLKARMGQEITRR